MQKMVLQGFLHTLPRVDSALFCLVISYKTLVLVPAVKVKSGLRTNQCSHLPGHSNLSKSKNKIGESF